MDVWVQNFPFEDEATREELAADDGTIPLSEEVVLAIAEQVLGCTCESIEDVMRQCEIFLDGHCKGDFRQYELSAKGPVEYAAMTVLWCAMQVHPKEKQACVNVLFKFDKAVYAAIQWDLIEVCGRIRERKTGVEIPALCRYNVKEAQTDGEQHKPETKPPTDSEPNSSPADENEGDIEDDVEATGSEAANEDLVTAQPGLVDADELERLKARVHELTRDKLALEQSSIESDARHEKVLARLQEREAELEAAQVRQKEMDRALRHSAKAEAVIEELEERLAEFERDTANECKLKERLKRSEATVERLASDVQAYRSTIKDLNKERDALQHRVDEMSTASALSPVAIADDSQSPTLRPRTRQQNKVDSLQAVNSRLERQIEELGAKNRELAAMLESARQAVDAEQRESAAKLESARQEVDSLRQKAEDVASLRQKAEEFDEWVDYSEKLEGDVENLREKNDELVDQLRKTASTLNDLNDAHVRLQTERDAFRTEASFWEEKMQNSHYKARDISKERDALAETLAEEREERNTLREECNTLRDQLNRALETNRMQAEDHEAATRQRSGAHAMKRRLVREFNAKLNDLLRKLKRLESELDVEREARRMACDKYKRLVEDVPRQIAARVQERVKAQQDAEAPALRKLVQQLSANDSPGLRGQARVRRNLDALVKDLVSTPNGKGAGANAVASAAASEAELTRLRDVNGRLSRENVWLREQFEGRGAPPSPSIDFDSARGPSETLVLTKAGGNNAVPHLRRALLELQRENDALRAANLAEINERTRIKGDLCALGKQLDRLRLKSVHANAKMIREKRVPAEAISSWFQAELERASVKADSIVMSSSSFVAPSTSRADDGDDAGRLEALRATSVPLYTEMGSVPASAGDAASPPLRSKARSLKAALTPHFDAASLLGKENTGEAANADVAATGDLSKTFASASDLAADEVPTVTGANALPFGGEDATFETPKQAHAGKKTFAGKRGPKNRSQGFDRSAGESVPARRQGPAAGLEPMSPADSMASWSSADVAADARRKRQNASRSFESYESETLTRALQGGRDNALRPSAIASARAIAVHQNRRVTAARRIFNESMESGAAGPAAGTAPSTGRHDGR